MTDVTDATFTTDVIERSSTVPVVVDLWAPWCGPCKTLGPLLEQVIAETNGQVELAKVNVDDNPGVAQAFQVQGIPAVYAMVDGQVADGFVGAQGEREVRAFVDKLLPSEQDRIVQRLLDQGDEASYREVLQAIPDHPQATVGLAELLVAGGDTDGALQLLKRIPETAETRRIAAEARAGNPGDDEIFRKLDELLPRVKGDDDIRQQFVTCSRCSAPIIPGPPSTGGASRPPCSDTAPGGDLDPSPRRPLALGGRTRAPGCVGHHHRAAHHRPAPGGRVAHPVAPRDGPRPAVASPGPVRFVARYVAGYLRWRLKGYPHKAAYRRIPAEVEAYWEQRQHPGPEDHDGATGERRG